MQGEDAVNWHGSKGETSFMELDQQYGLNIRNPSRHMTISRSTRRALIEQIPPPRLTPHHGMLKKSIDPDPLQKCYRSFLESCSTPPQNFKEIDSVLFEPSCLKGNIKHNLKGKNVTFYQFEYTVIY